MKNKKDGTHYSIKGLFKYISTIISWTIFTLLSIVGILLVYYYVSLQLYTTFGERFEPRFSVYTIVSPSMEPTVKVYDVIVNTKINTIEDVKINDVITFISTWDVTQGMTITHRVVGFKTLDTGEKCLITRGDNNTADDQACVKEGNIIGVTRGIIPGLGKVQFFLASTSGWLLIIIVLGIYLIIKNVLRLVKLANSLNEKEKDVKKKKIKKQDIDNSIQAKYKYLKSITDKRTKNKK